MQGAEQGSMMLEMYRVSVALLGGGRYVYQSRQLRLIEHGNQ